LLTLHTFISNGVRFFNVFVQQIYPGTAPFTLRPSFAASQDNRPGPIRGDVMIAVAVTVHDDVQRPSFARTLMNKKRSCLRPFATRRC
jgi:hypothetical protein